MTGLARIHKEGCFILKRSVGGQHSRTWRSEDRENFRSEARDSGQNVLTDELPDRFEFELLRSTFESVDQRMNSPEQYFRFVGTNAASAKSIGWSRYLRINSLM